MARRFLVGWIWAASVSFSTSLAAEEQGVERSLAAFTPGTVISVGQDIVVGVISRGTTTGDGVIRNVVLDLEAISASLQSVMGGKSARVVIDADCQSRRIATQSMQIFERPNATGAAKAKGVITDWTTAPTGSYGADVLDLYCRPAALAALAASPKAAAEADLKSTVSKPSLAKTIRASSTTPSTVSPAAPTPSASANKPVLLMTAVVTPSVSKSASESRQGGYGVQLLSSMSSKEAQAGLARLKASYAFWPAGRDAFVNQAMVNGSSRYRIRLGGFARLADANAFCDQVTAVGGQCMVVKAPF